MGLAAAGLAGVFPVSWARALPPNPARAKKTASATAIVLLLLIVSSLLRW
jgi:hypothetical protein